MDAPENAPREPSSDSSGRRNRGRQRQGRQTTQQSAVERRPPAQASETEAGNDGFQLRLDLNLEYLHESQVSRTWHETISGSPELQYAIKLWKDGLEPGCSDSTPIFDKLQAVYKRRHAWQNLEWTSKTAVEMPSLEFSPTYTLVGGFMTLRKGAYLCTLSLHALDRDPLVGVTKHALVLGLEMPHFDILTTDPTQDLLVVLYRQDLQSAILAFRSLSTNQPHPKACEPNIRFELDEEEESRSIQIADDVIGVSFIQPEVFDVRLWNWQTGISLADLSTNAVDADFRFLSPCAFTVCVPTADGGQIEIYTIAVASLTQVAILHLPDLADGWDLNGIRIDSGSISGRPTQGPFSSASEQRIYVFLLRYRFGINPLRLVVHYRTLARYVQEARATPVVVPWEDWGPRGTRILDAHEFSWMRKVFLRALPTMTDRVLIRRVNREHPHGERLLVPATDGKYIRLLDFNVIPGLFTNHTGTLIQESSTVTRPFRNPVSTSLPFRLTAHAIDEEFDVPMIDEAHMVGSRWGINKMTVFTFRQ
ncbi:hypothetical protein FB45DRAFT_1104708 [Roridomyces roridus]|uniref:Uncharacterized protein n=1 Tax=Roridomyces roridus TaxID=1738132 RepID=A0AAD7FFL1_9AGAR|nr:hypothetical protein FB45DRAFT_1104708 [Roridomyces roridus]